MTGGHLSLSVVVSLSIFHLLSPLQHWREGRHQRFIFLASPLFLLLPFLSEPPSSSSFRPLPPTTSVASLALLLSHPSLPSRLCSPFTPSVFRFSRCHVEGVHFCFVDCICVIVCVCEVPSHAWSSSTRSLHFLWFLFSATHWASLDGVQPCLSHCDCPPPCVTSGVFF